MLLSAVAVNKNTILSGVVDHSTAFLQYLNKLGLELGSRLEVNERNDFDGSMKVQLNNKLYVFLSKEVAKNLLVKIIYSE
jgi:DtxR family Mn-dependent transcriptional regulator